MPFICIKLNSQFGCINKRNRFKPETISRPPLAGNRIAAGLILGLACFAAVLTGGIFVGQTIGEALSTLQTIAPVQVDPLR